VARSGAVASGVAIDLGSRSPSTKEDVVAVAYLGLDGDEWAWWWLAMTNIEGARGSESRGEG
jgi:hypothetical protein